MFSCPGEYLHKKKKIRIKLCCLVNVFNGTSTQLGLSRDSSAPVYTIKGSFHVLYSSLYRTCFPVLENIYMKKKIKIKQICLIMSQTLFQLTDLCSRTFYWHLQSIKEYPIYLQVHNGCFIFSLWRERCKQTKCNFVIFLEEYTEVLFDTYVWG